ncbi:unnamed protein product [Bathycoccus prasinos]
MKIRSKLMRFKDIPSRLCYSATDFKHQKGIAIVGGASPRYRTAFWVAIHCIRRVDPQIPIELWLPDGDESVLSIENLEYLQNNFVWLRNFKEIYSGIKGFELPKNFELKIYALLFSDFKEVLLLDSDNLPISSVEHLFNDTDYIKHVSLSVVPITSAYLNKGISGEQGVSMGTLCYNTILMGIHYFYTRISGNGHRMCL